jgi:hypothetical protein
VPQQPRTVADAEQRQRQPSPATFGPGVSPDPQTQDDDHRQGQREGEQDRAGRREGQHDERAENEPDRPVCLDPGAVEHAVELQLSSGGEREHEDGEQPRRPQGHQGHQERNPDEGAQNPLREHGLRDVAAGAAAYSPPNRRERRWYSATAP